MARTVFGLTVLALVGGVAVAAFWPSGEERAESLAVKSIERMDEGIYKPNNALAFASAAEEMGQEEEAVDFTETFAEEHTTETPILEQGLTDEGQMSAQDVVAETPVASEEVVEEVLAEEEVIEAPEVEVAEVEVEKNTFAANFLKKFKLNFKEEQEKEKDTWVLKVPVNE